MLKQAILNSYPNMPTGIVAQELNKVKQDILLVKETWLTDRGVVSKLVPVHGVDLCDSISNKLDAIATQSATVKRMVNRLYNDSQGLNFGDAGLRAMFESWRGKVLTADEADALLSLGLQPSSHYEQIAGVGKTITESEVITALE